MHQTQKDLLALAKTTDLSRLSLGEIARRVGQPHSQTIKHHLLQLDKRGLLPYPFLQKRLAGSDADSLKTVSVPIVGSANCGPASLLAEENIEGYLKVSPTLIGNRQHLFAVKAVGESMNKAKAGKLNPKPIRHGDYVVIERKQYQPRNGDYVLSIIDGAANIKRFHQTNSEEVALISDSTMDYPPIFIHAGDEFAISGEVIQVLRS